MEQLKSFLEKRPAYSYRILKSEELKTIGVEVTLPGKGTLLYIFDHDGKFRKVFLDNIPCNFPDYNTAIYALELLLEDIEEIEEIEERKLVHLYLDV